MFSLSHHWSDLHSLFIPLKHLPGALGQWQRTGHLIWGVCTNIVIPLAFSPAAGGTAAGGPIPASFDAVGSESVPSCLHHKQCSAFFATAGNELSYCPPRSDRSSVCCLACSCTSATRGQATSARGESAVVSGHPLVPSSETCAVAAALEAKGIRLHLLLGRVFPLLDKEAGELKAFNFMHLYHRRNLLVACRH